MPLLLRLAAAIAVSGGLYLTALSLPPMGTPFLLLVPFPGLLLAVRRGVIDSAAWLLFTAGATAALVGWAAVPGLVLPLGLPALVMTLALWRTWSLERTVLAGLATWTVGVTCMALLEYGDVVAMVNSAREQIDKSFALALSTSESLGTAGTATVLTEADRSALVDALLGILPALVVLTGAVMVIGNVVLLRASTGVFQEVNLRMWRTPDALIWALIAAGFGMYAPVPWAALTARNLFVVLLGCYFCQGLAIVAYYLDRFRLPRGIRIAGYVLIAVQHVVTAVVLALGVFDLWGNFRRSSAGPADVRFDADGD